MASPPSRLLDRRRALLPAAQTAEPVACYVALTEGGASFLGLVLAQDLGPLWHHSLQSGGLVESLPSDSIDALRQARISAAVSYLAQRSALDRIDRLFDTEGIAYVVMKGAHVRERGRHVARAAS